MGNVQKQSYFRAGDSDIPEEQNLADKSAYDIDRKLGRGATGKVFSARLKANNLPVAIKTINVKTRKGRHYLEDTFENELELLTKIKHPHIVRCYE